MAASAAATLGLGALLHFGVSVGDTDTPPLGRFLDPYTGFYRSNAVGYYDDDARLPGLRAPVDVYYDERLVPHIYASDAGDLYFAQGYVQAQHRLFQLDLTARSAEGRLSEVLGPRTLALDRERRRTGGPQLADAIDSMWRADAAAYATVSRYAEGVNAYLATLDPVDYPIEYKLLDFAPEAWSPRKTALVALAMAYTLNYRNDDLAATNTRALVGAGDFADLFPERNPRVPPVIPPGTAFPGRDTALLGASRRVDPQWGRNVGSGPPGSEGYAPEPAGIGSNNWVLAGARTATGLPLLANDPHLRLTLPSIWFESELHAPGLAVHGVNLPGVPGVTIGFNRDVAWGVTNVGVDVLDWHRVDWVDAARTRYRMRDGTERAVERRVNRIRVRGQADVLDTVVVTAMGPIVYTEPGDHRRGLALDWLTMRRPSSRTIETFLGLNRADDLGDYLAAARQYEWPAQNLVFGSREGDIAMRVSGTLPRRLPGQGRFLLDADAEAAEGYVDPAENPLAVNPPQGYLASANQVSTDASYPYYYQGGFADYRARRINELLAGVNAATLDDMARVQLDDYSVLASELTPALLGLLREDGLSLEARGAVELLRSWDYRYRAGAFAPVVLSLWAEAVREATWDEFSGDEDSGPLLRPEWWRLVELLESDPLHPYFDRRDTPEREDARAIVTQALADVAPRIDSLSDLGDYDWARHNRVRVGHLARVDAFGRAGLRASGTWSAVNSQRGDVGPSWRMLVELGAEPRARVVYPGGQSGRPGHPHYADMLDDWADGSYYDVVLRDVDAMRALDAGTHVSLSP